MNRDVESEAHPVTLGIQALQEPERSPSREVENGNAANSIAVFVKQDGGSSILQRGLLKQNI